MTPQDAGVLSELDVAMMTRAVLAALRGSPSPNPHVGAIVAVGDEVVGEGHHERAGEAHAEVMALANAGERARGATLYVTLEPCNHQGRTSPCTVAIKQAGITRVVIGSLDPNPHVKGGGASALREVGIEVSIGVHVACTDKILKPWVKHVTTQLPYVSLKLALSLDGRIATRSGSSRWITGAVARAKVHELRGKHDAIAVGVGTVLADDPQLTVRDAQGRDPTRVVFDSRLRIPLNANIVQTAREVPTIVLTALHGGMLDHERALSDLGVTVVRLPETPLRRVDLGAALLYLGSLGLVSLMVEGGAELAGSFLAGEYADDLHAFIAPLLLGPRGRAGAVDWAGPELVSDAPRIENPTWELCDGDAYVFGTLAYGAPA